METELRGAGPRADAQNPAAPAGARTRRQAHPALPIGRRDARAFSVREHAATPRPAYPLLPPTFLIRGAARKQPPGCFVLSEALGATELFLPFSFRRRKAANIATSKTFDPSQLLPFDEKIERERKRGKKTSATPIPSFKRTDTRTQKRGPSAYAHAHANERSHVHPRMLRALRSLSLRFIIGSRPDLTARGLLIGRRDASWPTPLILIYPRKNCIDCSATRDRVGSTRPSDRDSFTGCSMV